MNVIYKDEITEIHDDRELLTIDQAIDILWNGGVVRLCYPPDFTEDPPEEDQGCLYEIKELLSFEICESNAISKEQKKAMLAEKLRGYELYAR